MRRIDEARRVVVKVGSSLIIGADGHVRREWLATLADDILALKTQGKQVIIVTSGAVGLGRHVLSYGTRALKLEEKQAAAASGQIPLFMQWASAFGLGDSDHGADRVKLAQVLLTIEDSENRRRYLNACNTLETLLENGAIPVINENDTVATTELRFGDNDRLAARVAQMVSADLLILLSDIDGLYTANPALDPTAKHLPDVRAITPEIEAMAGGVGSAVGSGGMRTKIEAAKIALAASCHMVIAKGTEAHPLAHLQDGGRHSWFVASGTPKSARKHWIAGSIHAAGSLVVDDGARAALAQGRSLLPAGVKQIEGPFERGDAVLIKDLEGRVLGKGLSAYSAADAERIIGRKSVEIEAILGFKGRDTLVHRDDMVLDA